MSPRAGAVGHWLPTPVEIVLIIVFVATTWGVPSDDIWWHLACGRIFAEHRGFPATDPLSIVSHGHPWIAHYWLWDLWAWHLVSRAGIGPLLWLKGLAAAATVVLALAVCRTRGAVSLSALAVALAITVCGVKAQFWNLRPQLVTPLGTAIVTYLGWTFVLGGRDRLWLVPAVMVVWVNCHGGYVFGLVTLGTFLLAQCWRLFRGEPQARSRVVRLAIVLAASIGACCVNPYGPRHLLYPIWYLANPSLQTRITEWAATVLRDEPALEACLLLLVVALAVARTAAWPEEVLQLCIGLHFVFQAPRNFFLLATWFAPPIAARIEALAASMPPGRWTRPGSPLASPRSRGAFLFALVMLPYLATRQELPYEKGFQAPVHQLEAARRLPPGVEMFNQYELGGLVAHHLWPRRPFIDGRSDLHVVSGGFARFLQIWDLEPGWERELEDRYRVGAALLDRDARLAGALRARGWTVASPGGRHELLLAPGVALAPQGGPRGR